MGLETRYRDFLDSTNEIKDELYRFIRSIEKLELEGDLQDEVVEELKQFHDSLLNVEMSVSDPRRPNFGEELLIRDYKIVLECIRAERQLRQDFEELNQKIARAQARRMSRFLGHSLDYSKAEAEQLAVPVLKGETERSERYVKLARKKGYLSRKSDYNAFQAEEEFKQIVRFEEEYARDFARFVKKKGFEYGERKLENRPVIYIDRKALEKANKVTREATIEDDIRETGGVFYSKRLGDRRILLEDFKNWDTFDDRNSTTPRDEHYDQMWGESGRNLIFWHCHPRASDVEVGANYSDRLSNGDVEGLRKTLADGSDFGLMPGEKAGLREGITILSTAWDDKPVPEEDIVWLACAVSSQGGSSGFFNLHVVDGEPGNRDIVDDRYSWTGIYNKWIKAAMAGAKVVGPYSEYLEVNSLEEDLNYY